MAATHVCHLLIIEDDAAISALVREVLGDEGHRITAVATVDAAITALTETTFDLVLTDYFGPHPLQPDSDQWGVLQRICTLAGDTAVVLCSAHTPRVFEGYRACGIDDLLPKPFAVSDLIATVNRNIADDCELEQVAD